MMVNSNERMLAIQTYTVTSYLTNWACHNGSQGGERESFKDVNMIPSWNIVRGLGLPNLDYYMFSFY